MSWSQRVWEYFVAPADDPRFAAHSDDHRRPPAAIVPPRTLPGIAVLCAATDAPALGAALGLLLATRHRAAAVAVCLWSGDQPPRARWRAPALPSAQRLAATLRTRGHDVTSGGRLATVCLPAAAADAATEARRALAAAASAGSPGVLALGGPRAAAFDDLLCEQDLVVVAARGADTPALARLVIESLADEVVRACACDVPPAPPARALAEAGLVLLPSARRALAGPIGAMS